MSAELHDRAFRLLLVVNTQNIFDGERLEVQLVRSVVVGRDGLRITVDHDGLIAFISKCERGVDTAVVELDALADAVGAAAENHYLPFLADIDFVRGVICGEIIGRIFHAAHGDRLPRLGNIQAKTSFSDLFFRNFQQFRQILVRESVLLRLD